MLIEMDKASSESIQRSLRKLQEDHEMASTSCRKTYDLRGSFVRALIDVAWGTATALYSQGIGATLSLFSFQFIHLYLPNLRTCAVVNDFTAHAMDSSDHFFAIAIKGWKSVGRATAGCRC